MIDIRTHLDKFKENTVHSDSFLIAMVIEQCHYCRRPRQAVSIIKDDKVCEDCIDKLEALKKVPHLAINSRTLYTPQRYDSTRALAKVRLYTLNMIDLMAQDIQEMEDNHKTYALIMLYKHTINQLPPEYNVLYTATRKLYNISESNYLHISIVVAVRSVLSVAFQHSLISKEYTDSAYEELSEVYNSDLSQ